MPPHPRREPLGKALAKANFHFVASRYRQLVEALGAEYSEERGWLLPFFVHESPDELLPVEEWKQRRRNAAMAVARRAVFQCEAGDNAQGHLENAYRLAAHQAEGRDAGADKSVWDTFVNRLARTLTALHRERKQHALARQDADAELLQAEHRERALRQALHTIVLAPTPADQADAINAAKKVAEQRSEGSALTAPPRVGNCETCWAGAFACKYVELCGDEVDGCSNMSVAADRFLDGELGDLCPAFECDPQAMLERALAWGDRLQSQLTSARDLVLAARKGLADMDCEEEIRAAINAFAKASGQRHLEV